MKFVENVKIDIQKVNQEFYLGDLTIFIGRSNCGKSRILATLHDKLQTIYHNYHDLKTRHPNAMSIYKEQGITIYPEPPAPYSANLLMSRRDPKGNLGGFSKSLARFAYSFGKIDPTIVDVGTTEVDLDNNKQRPISEQGSGFHSMGQIFETLNSRADVVLIDEPEVSQFPYGKIEILTHILEKAKKKQIIVATHDPTLINQYLIRKNIDENIKVIVYSFCDNKFERIDLTNCDPEIHAGYLSQTYSGKPVHLIVEGQTEYYAFQALLFKFAQYAKIDHFPKFMNRISISYIAGGQWNINRHHLPDPRYYDVLVVMDGEHREKIENGDIGDNADFITSIDGAKSGSVNWYCIEPKTIEEEFTGIFSPVSMDKPIGLSMQIWAMEPNKIPIELQNIVKWCYEKAGATISRTKH